MQAKKITVDRAVDGERETSGQTVQEITRPRNDTIPPMARGWESKSVESQIEMAREDAARRGRSAPTRAEAELLRKKEGLLLSRTRVRQELANARNEGYRRILRDALSKLDEDLASIGIGPGQDH